MSQNFLKQNLYLQPKSYIEYLTEIEDHLVQTDYCGDLCIHQLFETQVEQTPDALAVVFENQQLTYRQLNQRANQLAHHLRSLGVAPEVLVGICMERSLEMVVGLLGILKAGGAYVPLDPGYPLERLTFILEDTQTPVMLTQEQLVNKLPDHQAQLICLDSDWDIIAQNSQENLACEATADNLVYVIYTSGSTGKPKGVMIPHRGICNQLYWRQTTFKLTEQDKVLQTISFSFDPSVWQIFWTLSFGAQLIMARPGGHQDTAYLVKMIVEQQITVLALVPSLLRVLLEEKGIENCQCLKHITCGGEALTVELIEHFFARLNLDNVLVNCYGPTEASIDATFWVCQRGTDHSIAPIGRPIANAEIYILDEDLQPVPVGEPGELHIGGVGLARGYLNRPDLTKEKFITHPLILNPVASESLKNRRDAEGAEEEIRRNNSDTNGFDMSSEAIARLYKTGDLARYLPDGNIEFLGRIDDQVKIRGFRIELGEIEAKLSTHGALKQTLVMAREDVPGDKRLVAYVVLQPQVTLTAKELRCFLLEQLPQYMVPTSFVFLDTLPLNPNGKVDRRALPAPDVSDFLDTNIFVEPRNSTEEVLAGIWAQVLGMEQVGIHNDFFELGGHSLLATQVISRARQALSVNIPLQLLFEAPTIADLASAIQNQGTEEHQIQDLRTSNGKTNRQGRIRPEGACRRLGHKEIRVSESFCVSPEIITQQAKQHSPLSFAQQRMWFLEQIEPNNAAYLIPIAHRLTGQLNVGVLQKSLDAIAVHHQVLLTNYILSPDGNPIQVIATPRLVQLKVIDLTQEQHNHLEEQVQRLLSHEAQRPFDLTSDLMLRATLVQINQQEHILLLVMHHIASDGWSMGILCQQLAALYEAFLHDLPNPLPNLPIQYADFAIWQRQWLSDQRLETQLDYWKTQLADATPLEFPTDQPRSSVQNHKGARQSTIISQKLTEALKELSRRSNATLFMTLLAAFKILLYRYTLQEDIIVGTPIAGRNQTETEGLIGCFINTLALRTDLGGNPSFLELLSRVRQVALDAYTHQEMPFEKLVEELQPERNLSRNPVFDVMFNFINTPVTALEFPGLSVSSLELNEPESIFSMTLYVEEHLGELKLQLVYQRALFSAARMSCLLEQFQHLLEQIVAVRDRPIGLYSLVTPKSRSLLPDLSAVLPQPRYELVTTMFASWVKSTPEHLAVCQGNRSWNYSQLSITAHNLAQVLLSHGIKRGEVVAVFGSRSFGLIASMIGVLLSGGVLLTIDPKLPSYRQQMMLAEAKARYSLYVGGEQPEKSDLPIIYVDPNTGVAITNTDSHEAIHLPQLSGDDAAYIFFTSGTTGIPKGVLGCHKGMAHFLNWQRQTFAIDQQDRCAQLTLLSFDVVLRDIFLPLTSGATLCLPAEGDELEPTRILRWLEREQITLLHTVPTLAQSWLVNVPPEVSLRSLKCIFFAGEPLKDTLLRLWNSIFPQAGEIVNLYGPTETTLAKCYYRVTGDILPGVQPVGSPLPETQALVLAENNQLCGIGEPGQIVIRTPFRSLGYINASQENSSRFVKNPLGNDEQDLLYYTGDRGRYRPDGSLEILGRLDRQVKIRGVRIELREIETVLGEHPAVREVVVIAREDQPGDQRLVAYIVPQQKQVSAYLRQFLMEKLPKYMIPSAFVMIEAFPLTPNGKVDRRALPMPEQNRQEVEETFVAPRNELECQIVQIWEEVLGIQPISVKDNFFDLGGHSLLAVRLFAQIEKQFGRSIPLATLFTCGTVETLAKILYQEQELATHQKKSKTSWSSLVEIQPNGDKPPLFCIHPLGGEIICYRPLAQRLGSDQPIYALQPHGLDGQLPYTRIEDMASHYIREIQTIQRHGPYFLVGYSFGGMIAFEMARQLHSQGEKVGVLVMIDSLLPGYSKRLPFLKRLPLHFKNILQQGPTYIWQKLADWREWNTYNFKQRYKRYLEQAHQIEETDKHLNIIDANLQARDEYVLQVYPGSMTLLRTEDQNRGDAFGMQYDPQYGWGNFITGELKVDYIPGSHLTCLEEPNVQVLSEKLQNCLEKAYTSIRCHP
jgi:amino acid adenylation domain-containing protein